METMRDLLRGNLARSLSHLTDEDKLSAAWTVACGRAMAERGTVVGFDAGVVRILVADVAWQSQMVSMRAQLARELARIAGLPVIGIHFEVGNAGKGVRTDRHG
jgi:hypothetical protein